MPKAAKKAKKRAKKKAASDIFIYRTESGGYSADPSPFIIRTDPEPIQFRNLTNTRIKLRFKKGPVVPPTFTMGPITTKVVTVSDSAESGVYEYKIEFGTPAAAPRLQQLPKIYAQGHSSPKMIVDT